MAADHTWDRSAAIYAGLYKAAAAEHGAGDVPHAGRERTGG